jgi:hypothetical protein
VDEVIKSLRSMGAGGGSADPRGLQQLAGTALDKAKKLDFDLRKRTDTSTDQMFLAATKKRRRSTSRWWTSTTAISPRRVAARRCRRLQRAGAGGGSSVQSWVLSLGS